MCVDTADSSSLCLEYRRLQVVSVNLVLLGRLASDRRGREHKGRRERGRGRGNKQGRAPLGCHGSREMHHGIVCFQGEAGCSCSIGQFKADQHVDLLLIGCITTFRAILNHACF